jgi:hypothetical protein
MSQQLTLPDDHYTPPQPFQLPFGHTVTFHVLGEFPGPKLDVGLGDTGILAAAVTVPIAAVYEYGGSPLGEYHIGASRKSRIPQPIPESEPVQPAPQDPLRFRVPATNPCHETRTLLLRKDVSHVIYSRALPFTVTILKIHGTHGSRVGRTLTTSPEMRTAAPWRVNVISYNAFTLCTSA